MKYIALLLILAGCYYRDTPIQVNECEIFKSIYPTTDAEYIVFKDMELEKQIREHNKKILCVCQHARLTECEK